MSELTVRLGRKVGIEDGFRLLMRGAGGLVRLLAIATFFVALFDRSPAAFAIPAPMSPEGLLENSDLVALVRVVAVTCIAEWQDEQTGETLHGYSAELELIEVRKGIAEPGDIVDVRFKDLPSGILGPWEVFYYPGEKLWTHLQRDDGGSAYTTTWWNARGEILHEAIITDLPTTLGETVRLP